MLPSKCITCGKLLADIELDFEEMLDNIKEKKLSKEKREKMQKMFLDKHFIINICCRTHVITYVDTIKIMI